MDLVGFVIKYRPLNFHNQRLLIYVWCLTWRVGFWYSEFSVWAVFLCAVLQLMFCYVMQWHSYIFKCDLSSLILLGPLFMYCFVSFVCLIVLGRWWCHPLVYGHAQTCSRWAKREGPWWEKGWANQIYHSKYLFTRWALLIHLSLLYKQRLPACVLHMRITVCGERGCVWGHWVTEVSHAWDTNAGRALWRGRRVCFCVWSNRLLELHIHTGAGHIIRISSKSWFISLIPFKKWNLYNVYIHSTQTDIFQVFISFNFDDYNWQLMKTPNSVSQKIRILLKTNTKKGFLEILANWKVWTWKVWACTALNT